MKRSRHRPALLARTKPATISKDELLSIQFAKENLRRSLREVRIATEFIRQLSNAKDQRIRAFSARFIGATAHSRKRLEHLEVVLQQLFDEHVADTPFFEDKKAV